ncbi:putative c6 finger domain protein [Eutypa lata UCREL1]|uniref:Putative c6 finger domain protein n=1 Tax=Eutypa lata (strain UCR-EL1) TaxID=1287681 RepID=M7TY32_EUTLA|nr:putative c6 finger domain protein [Eutypa lata UCREL1]
MIAKGGRANHSKESWEKQRNVIEQLYCGHHFTMAQVKGELDKRGFVATEREYYPRIKEWGLTKNIRGDEMGIMYRKMLERKTQHGKETIFTLHGREVDLKKVHRFVKRVSLSPSKLPQASQ